MDQTNIINAYIPQVIMDSSIKLTVAEYGSVASTVTVLFRGGKELVLGGRGSVDVGSVVVANGSWVNVCVKPVETHMLLLYRGVNFPESLI